MLDTSLIKRDFYLNKLINFKDTSYIKVITGVRRSGKSKLMHLMAEYLLETGINKDQIIEMNFESFQYKNMTADEVYLHITNNINKEKKSLYLFG